MTAPLDDASKLLMWSTMSPLSRRLMWRAFGVNEEMINIYRESLGMKRLGEQDVHFVVAQKSDLTPDQLREMQDALNHLAGDPAWKHKIIVLPAGSTVKNL